MAARSPVAKRRLAAAPVGRSRVPTTSVGFVGHVGADNGRVIDGAARGHMVHDELADASSNSAT